jgi:hypothetical protein
MLALPLALTVAVMALFLGCCTAVLLRYRKGRLAADALQLLQRIEPSAKLAPPVLPFAPAGPVGLPRQDLARVSGLVLAEAEDMLDWLEQNGFDERSLLCESGTLFAVEFRLDSGQVQPAAPHQAPMRRYTAG